MRVRAPPKKGAIPLRTRSLHNTKINERYQCEHALPPKKGATRCAPARSVNQRLTRAINASTRSPKKGAIPLRIRSLHNTKINASYQCEHALPQKGRNSLRIRSLHNTKINERYQCERLPQAACCLRRTRCTLLPIFCRRDGRTRQESSSSCRGKGFSCPSRSRGFRSRTFS